jgi:hypothetical protein
VLENRDTELQEEIASWKMASKVVENAARF